MRPTTLVGLVLLATFASAATHAASAGVPLKTPADFTTITDPTERSRALFAEMGKVIESPRCQNCHPVGQRPTQGDDMHPHLPLVARGTDDQGAIAAGAARQVARRSPTNVVSRIASP